MNFGGHNLTHEYSQIYTFVYSYIVIKIQKHFYRPQKLCHLFPASPPNASRFRQSLYFLLLLDLSFLGFHINIYVLFCVLFPLLNRMSLRFIHIITSLSNFSFSSLNSTPLYINPPVYLSIHLLTDTKLFHVLTNMNKAAMNIHGQGFVYMYIFISFR